MTKALFKVRISFVPSHLVVEQYLLSAYCVLDVGSRIREQNRWNSPLVKLTLMLGGKTVKPYNTVNKWITVCSANAVEKAESEELGAYRVVWGVRWPESNVWGPTWTSWVSEPLILGGKSKWTTSPVSKGALHLLWVGGGFHRGETWPNPLCFPGNNLTGKEALAWFFRRTSPKHRP